MAPYNQQYGSNYYDPMGSQPAQPTGYTSQTPSTNAASYPSAATADYQNYGNTYGNQQYGVNNQTAPSSTNRAAAALSSLSSNDYNQHQRSTTTPTSYEGPSWGNATYGNYNNLQMPNRTQSNNSPVYSATQATSATFGRLSAPDSTQGYQQPSTATSSSSLYQTAYTQPAQQQTQPQRYASPLQAVQAQQQGHARQRSRNSANGPSPRMNAQSIQQQATNRQQSASVEPSTTVNPSQVYDDRAERQRKARIEEERKRKREAEEAARQAEEDRIAEEKRKVEEEKQKVEQQKAELAAKQKAEVERKAEQRKKAREEKRQSKTAATALQKMASSGTSGGPSVMGSSGATDKTLTNDEEAEMRAMFQKMREFNSRNPAMLAKLWEEERKSHSGNAPSTSPQQSKATPAPAAKATPTTTKASTSQQSQSAASSSAVATPASASQQFRPFQKQTQPAKGKDGASKSPQQSTPAKTLWPPHKMGIISEAAAKWLQTHPANPSKKNDVAPADVLTILKANPTYVELCEALEALGLSFERSLLARELLSAVPDPKSPQSSNKASPLGNAQGNSKATKPRNLSRLSESTIASLGKTNGSSTGLSYQNGTVDYGVPSFTSLADAAREVNNMGRSQTRETPAPMPMSPQGGPVQPPQASDYYPTQSQTFGNDSRPPSQSQPPAQTPMIKPEEPRLPPANKEEAARKRTFGEMVDLTAGDSDDEPPPKKVNFNGPVSAPQPQPQNSFKQPMSFQDFYNKTRGPIVPISSNVPDTAPMPIKGTKPIPSTFQMGPAAQPVAVAPPPVPRPVVPRGPTAEQLQESRIKGKMLVEPIMRDRVARKNKYDSRTIARDVLLATGRHPDMRPLNSHMNAMQKMLGDHGGSYEGNGNRSDLATIRWDIIDPEPAKTKLANIQPKQGRDTAEIYGGDADDDDDDLPHTVAPTSRIVQRAVNNGDGTMSYVAVSEPILNGKTGPKKRRGRLSMYSLPSDARTPANFTPNMRAPGSAPARQRAPNAATPGSAVTAADLASGKPIGYAASGQIDPDGNVIKKKGRPVGWRKSVHSREAQGLSPAKSHTPHKPLSNRPKNKDAVVEPKYQVYKCQWLDCEAELHNLETLKKHVVKIHGRPSEDGEYECLWKGCEGELEEGHIERDVAKFGKLEEWVGHVNGRHLAGVAWELGDGPRGGMSDHHATDSEALYLSDAQGRSVTPIISSHDPTIAEASSRILPKGIRKQGAMGKEEKMAREELRKLAERKKVVGPTMEREGARFANKKRRGGFLDDEDFEDVVESDGVRSEGEKNDEDEE